jgi:hypothetical protein
LLVKIIGSSIRKISANKNRPQTTTAPCQELIAPTSLEIAIEFVAMYFLLFLVESAYEQPCNLCLSAPAKIDFLSFFNQRAPERAFFGAGKFTWAHAENFVGCWPAILLASAIWSRESEPKYV